MQIKAFDVPSGQFRDVYISAQTTTMKEPLKYSIAKRVSQLSSDLMEKARLEVLEDIIGNLDGTAAYKSLKRRGVVNIDTAVNNKAHVNITWGELAHFAEISGFNVVRSDNTYRFSRIVTKRSGI